MQCPACATELTKSKSFDGLIDKCPQCHGIWLDSGNLLYSVVALVENQAPKAPLPVLFKSRMVVPANAVDETLRQCPRCKQTLTKINYGYDSNVFIDKCPACQGIWVDESELRDIAQHLKVDPRVTEIGKEILESNQTSKDIQSLAEIGDTLNGNATALAFMPKIVLPLGDKLSTARFPVVNISIIGITVLTFIYQISRGADGVTFIDQFGRIPVRIMQGEAFYTLITSVFLHRSFLHLLGNMFFLWIFGDNVEDRIGHLGYLGFYLTCGIAAGFMHIYFYPTSELPSIGASGAISGIMSAYLVFYPYSKIKTYFWGRIINIPAVLWLGTWFLLQVIYGILYYMVGGSNIGWFAHIGGFIFGGIVAYLIKKLT
ncbi:MAG: rhomboid family intramembrane serine protease [bacterium]